MCYLLIGSVALLVVIISLTGGLGREPLKLCNDGSVNH